MKIFLVLLFTFFASTTYADKDSAFTGGLQCENKTDGFYGMTLSLTVTSKEIIAKEYYKNGEEASVDKRKIKYSEFKRISSFFLTEIYMEPTPVNMGKYTGNPDDDVTSYVQYRIYENNNGSIEVGVDYASIKDKRNVLDIVQIKNYECKLTR